ncbi:maleylpyruvate isomerase N-terminal domain-containing protein [Nocardioides sp. zg-DK7169]|uniref:maleylpyruvate isomerase N-terminal domain-containing protein n=1 Tax=Nocardioides sp. zg-DK7169 TaxID=2736600 RepID=UPI001C12DF1B|nr:maleylpyruvate isomerase N-terminal domain-containing protein [Nocardioides sp. zg-DK7169]
MTRRLDGDVELLERSLAYAGGVLVGVATGDLSRPTPCAAWDLERLLAHLEDGLDAFLEAATGRIAAGPAVSGAGPAQRAAALRDKAGVLLGAWVGGPGGCGRRERVGVGDAERGTAELEAGLLLRAAALEVAVHAHDVAVASASPGSPHPFPEDLARDLLAVAHEVVAAEDRPARFAAPRVVPAGATYADRLLGHLGRAPHLWEGPIAAKPHGRDGGLPNLPS